MDDLDYHHTRLREDAKRSILWGTLSKYLQRHVPEQSTVLDFGAGYCDFINNITAKRKIAFDQWEGIRRHASTGVELHIGHYSILNDLPRSSIDVIFASNVFEHFEAGELSVVIHMLKGLLRQGGRIIALQPNFHYAFRQYFDDYTHKSIWTHVSLPDFMAVHGLKPTLVKSAFLPLTVKSRLPVNSLLIRAYLASPLKPFAGQMLVVSELSA